MTKKILVDLSATLIHHGHIRLLKKASKYGKVVVALTSDEEVKKYKGYNPELNFNKRKEILESIKYVDKVIKSQWIIKDNFLKKHKINYLVHGSDNRNKVSLLEIYKSDADAVVHMKNFLTAPHSGPFLEIFEIESFKVLGNSSNELKKILNDFTKDHRILIDGFKRK